MSKSLQGRKVAVLAADGVEKVEFETPRARLTENGAHVALLLPKIVRG
jgi:protease I